jgi:hypothetical protein
LSESEVYTKKLNDLREYAKHLMLLNIKRAAKGKSAGLEKIIIESLRCFRQRLWSRLKDETVTMHTAYCHSDTRLRSIMQATQNIFDAFARGYETHHGRGQAKDTMRTLKNPLEG